MQVGDRHLGGRDQPKLIALGLIGFLRELGELPRAGHGVAGYQIRYPYLGVRVLIDMHIQKEVNEPALQPRTVRQQDRETGTADLGATREIEYAQRLPQLPVRAWLEVERRG